MSWVKAASLQQLREKPVVLKHAIKQIAESKDPKKLSGISLYSRFAFAGAVCCSVTHGALTPVDV